MRSRLVAALILLTAFSAFSLSAQDAAHEGPLAPSVQQRAMEILNDPGVLRVSGTTRIPAGTVVEGDLAVLGGSLVLGGELRGRLLVVNGDLVFEEGAQVSGEVLVVGGQLVERNLARLDGPVEVHAGPLRYRIRSGRVEVPPEARPGPGFLGSEFGFGRARLMVKSGESYNRVEGLPVLIGPIIETAGRNPTSLEALAIWRSASGFNIETEALGYSFLLRQAIGGRGTAFLGVGAHSEIHAIESRGVSSLESSLSTFLLRRDLRDFHEREGWRAFLEVQPAQFPIRASIGYREEDHAFSPIRSPWTLRDNEEPWRPQPLIAEGLVRLVGGEFALDTRDDPIDPSDGWRFEIDLARRVGGSLTDPISSEPVSDFTLGSVDLRRYARVSPESRLSLRGFFGGALTRTPLPSQFQRSLGGEGSLPGHPRFAVDCGARDTPLTRMVSDSSTAETVFGGYGCDRVALFQVEFRGTLPFSWEPSGDGWDQWEWSSLLDFRPAWSLFFDAGRGWALGDPGSPPLVRRNSPTRADIGAGLFVGPLGIHWAYPLNRKDQGLNFFVRLQHRF